MLFFIAAYLCLLPCALVLSVDVFVVIPALCTSTALTVCFCLCNLLLPFAPASASQLCFYFLHSPFCHACKYSGFCLQEKLGLILEKEDEMECLVGGCNFLLKAIRHEAFTYANGSLNFVTNTGKHPRCVLIFFLVSVFENSVLLTMMLANFGSQTRKLYYTSDQLSLQTHNDQGNLICLQSMVLPPMVLSL